MIHDAFTAKKIAELLIQINAIKLELKNPFTWASGWTSPIYCDNRIALSYPTVRTYLREEFAKQIEKQHGKPDAIAGVATGALGIGALVAEKLNLPFVYIRPKPKGHGRKNQIEGVLAKNSQVVVIEDLISTGKSSMQAIKALRESGASVKCLLSIFDYNFEVAKKRFKKENVSVYSLSDYNHLIELATENRFIMKSEEQILKNWRLVPQKWKP
ncbi:MAG: orotate phosphoribosyltransferase [Bacteroidota bacterium]|nr:orotate phosphoribosyltransferase [Bacteroidota bacterium]